MEKGESKIFCGNAKRVSLNVMIFKLCDRELTGLSKFKSLKLNFDVIEKKKKKADYFFAFLLRISIYIHHDPVMTLTHFMARSVYVVLDQFIGIYPRSQLSVYRIIVNFFLVIMFGP